MIKTSINTYVLVGWLSIRTLILAFAISTFFNTLLLYLVMYIFPQKYIFFQRKMYFFWDCKYGLRIWWWTEHKEVWDTPNNLGKTTTPDVYLICLWDIMQNLRYWRMVFSLVFFFLFSDWWYSCAQDSHYIMWNSKSEARKI